MDNQRLILLVALSFVTLLLWQAWQKDYYSPAPVTEEFTQAQVDASGMPIAAGVAEQKTSHADLPAAPSAPSAADTTPKASASGQTMAARLIEVDTDLVQAKIDLNGGQLVDLRLKRYPTELETPDEPFTLFKRNSEGVLVAQYGLVVNEGTSVTHKEQFNAAKPRYEMQDGDQTLVIPLIWTSEDGLQITKTFTFTRDSYQVALGHEISNGTGKPWKGSQYTQLVRSGANDHETSMMMPTYTGGAIYSEKDGYQKLSFDDLKSDKFSNRLITDGWVAFIQHYFVASLIPERGAASYYYGKRQTSSGHYALGVTTGSKSIPAGGKDSFTATLFAGPKEQDRMNAAAAELDRAVDYGFFYILSNPLFWLLNKIHDLVGNWGWAIIVLTMIIKLVFFKLSEAGYRSMARMRKMTPRIQQLRERYADDKQRLNQAMMDLYKTEKINPMGGCFPMLVQVPVFIALYHVLLESVEMRQAPWILWIEDMSRMDEFYVLPLLMGVTMFIQQKLNPPPPDPMQAKIMMMLPVVFTVFFAFFPAGLVLYWFSNNLLSIAQQWVINRRIERDSKA